MLAATDTVGSLAGIPVVAEIVNAVNGSRPGRVLLEKTLGVDRGAPLPKYQARSARRRLAALGTVTPAAAGGGARHGRHDRPRGALHHLLRQPQRAGAG